MKARKASGVLKTSEGEAGHAPRVLLVKGFFNDPGIGQIGHPLGIMSLAAVLRRDFGHDVRIVDMRLEGRSYERLEDQIRAFSPHVVGISAQSAESISIERIAARARKVDPGIVVILGGPHATAYAEIAALMPAIDYVVVGEGEVVTGELIGRLMSGRDVGDLAGLVYRKNGELVNNGRAEPCSDLDALPFPAYDLVPMTEYRKFVRFSTTGSGQYMSMFTSRACPYRCIYCHDIFGKSFRARSADSLLREITYLYETYGIREFEIFDDVFNLRRRRVLDICGRIIDSGMKITLAFPNGLRGDLLDEEQLLMLKRAGTIYLAFAIETAAPRMQKLIRKNLDLEKVRRNIDIARSLRIHSHGFFMIGFPGETLEEMNATVDFILSSRLHTFNLFIAMPYERTEMGAMAKKMGRGVVTDFSQDYYSKQFVNLTDVPRDAINGLRRRALLRFYMDPTRIYDILRDFPGDKSLLRLSRTFLRRLFWKT
jgi:anaerobic magnesium-protoporphyrin IX monomethyl ester cyclase